ncbi:DUF2686 family protein [Escherichia coli]|nr:DUF2686 family protein [Escherichia coli]
MSMPLSNTLQSQIITDNHFLHHPKVDSALTRKYERARLDTESMVTPVFATPILTISGLA